MTRSVGATKPPNILLVMFDQMSAQSLPCYGHAIVKAPHLQGLAQRGVVFENAYCNSPLCSPSRFAMMTGQLASRIGAYDNAAELNAGVPTLAHHLRALGYRTCLSGKMDFTGADQLHGYEERLTTDLSPSDFGWTPEWEAPEKLQPWFHDLASVVDAAYRQGTVLAYTKSDETAFAERLFERTRAFVAERFRGLPVRVGIAGGSLGAQAAVNAVVVREKIRNIAQVAAIIFILSAVALRSLVGGVFVLLPLAVALGLTVGVMGWSGVWLSMSTSAFMAMGVSIGADFAIYLIFRLREELARGALADSVRRALVTSGSAIFFVSSAVALGYLVLVFSGFKAWVHLGGLTALMMGLASVAAVTVLPALVMLLRPRVIVPQTVQGSPYARPQERFRVGT